MSKSRLINTKFWDDKYTANLDPIEKLLFIYFLTNPLTNLIGVYEIEVKRIAFDTGIDKEMVLKIIERFSKDKKIFYEQGFIIIKNFIKHQNQNSPKIKTAIEKQISELPENLKKCISVTEYGIYTVSYINTNINSNSNINFNSNLNLIKEKELSPDGDFLDSIIDLFCVEYKNTKQRDYISTGTKKNKYAGKDRKAVGLLLAFFKRHYPNENSNQIKNRFEKFFKLVFQIKNHWLSENLTLPILNSKINEIIETLKNEQLNNTNGKSDSNSSKGFDIRKNTWFTGA